MARFPINWPIHGESEHRPHAKQPDLTTAFSRNCRTLMGDTLRHQGGQRSGWRDFTPAPLEPGKPVDALVCCTVDLPKVEFTGPDRRPPALVWGRVVPGLRECLDLQVDGHGDLLVLDGNGSFRRMGPDGEAQTTVSFYTPQQEAVVKRIEIDSQGNVYVASSHPQGYSGRVYRYERVEPDDDDDEVFYVKAWESAGPWGVRDFRVSGGVLYVARFYSEQSQGFARADLQVIGQLSASSPTELYVAATPWPVSTIAVNEQGEVLAAAPANEKRTAILSDEGWGSSVVSWSLHELEDTTGYGTARRLHFWIDAYTLLDTHVDGSIVATIPDRRWIDTSLDFASTTAISEDQGALSGGGDGAYLPVIDTTPRPITQKLQAPPNQPGIGNIIGAALDALAQAQGAHDGIVFRPNGAGVGPAISFGGIGYPLMSTSRGMGAGNEPDNYGFKSDTDSPSDAISNDDGIATTVSGMVPVHAAACYATVFVVRYNVRSDHSELIWHHRSASGVQLALVMNADENSIYAGDTIQAVPGSLALFVGLEDGSIACASSGGVAGHRVVACDLTNDGTSGGTGAYALEDDYASSERIAIITLQHAGSTEYGGAAYNGGAPVHGQSFLRVNGRTVDTFSMVGQGGSPGLDDTFGTNGGQLHFNRYFWGDGSDPGMFGAWRGELLECYTVLGSTSSASNPNEVPVTFPGEPAGAAVPAVGGAVRQNTDMAAAPAYGSNPQGYTDYASEIERMEGVAAHKWGVDHVLPGGGGGVALSAAGGFQNWHPFGRDGSNNPRPPVGSPNAGGVPITETGLALLSPKELLFKLDVQGQVAWALSGGGHGLGVQAGPDGTVCAVGRHDADAGSTVVAKRVRDIGRKVLTTGDGTWEISDDRQPAQRPVHGLAVDDASNLYWPRHIAAYTVQQDFTANPTSGRTFYTGAFGTLERIYVFRPAPLTAPTPGTGQTNVLIGATAAESIQNFVQAVNDTGTSGSSGPYYRDVQLVGRDPYVSAAYETDSAANDYMRWTHRGFDGQADLTTASAALYPFTETPPGTVTYFGGVHIGFGGEIASRAEMRYAKDGALAWSRVIDSGNQGAEVLAIALDPDLPLYPDGSPLEDTPEHVYVALRENVDGEGETTTNPTRFNLEKVRQVHRVQVIDSNLSPRRSFYVGASGGSLYNLKLGEVPARFTSSMGLLTAGSPFTKLFVYRQKVYGLDGMRYVVFDPKTGKAEEWTAEGAGKIPFGAKLGCVWNGRIVLARTPDDPHNLYMSERGNPRGWDRNPPVLTPLSAWSGDSSGTLHFRTHGLVNCLLPLRDDLLLVGQDSAVHRLTGDPGGKGQLDLIMEGEGLAFGDCWAHGPGGTAYAKGINGGVWRFAPDGSYDRISLGWIERRLQAIDLVHYDVEMVWDFHNEGLLVLVVPKGVGGQIVQHYFWDSMNGGWWTDEFASADLQPTCVATFDGDDPNDRRVAIGCEDGRVRYLHPDEKNDGGQRIVSEVWLGPFNLEAAGRVAVSKLELVLASRYEGCLVELFVGDVADYTHPGAPVFASEITPGYTGWLAARASGNHVWLRLSNGALDERWALEEAVLTGRRAGRRRVR